MLTYALRSALTLALLYTGFLVLLSRETLHRLNRLLLLFCLAASLVLPLIHVTVDHPLSLLMMNRGNGRGSAAYRWSADERKRCQRGVSCNDSD